MWQEVIPKFMLRKALKCSWESIGFDGTLAQGSLLFYNLDQEVVHADKQFFRNL